MSAELILNRLDGVKEISRGSWMARCPAHEDSTPSLSVREVPQDGRVLLHCFGGCETASVLEAIGIEWRDVMPVMPEPIGGVKPHRVRFNALDAMSFAKHEVAACCLILSELLARRTPTEQDWSRLALAHARLSNFVDKVEER